MSIVPEKFINYWLAPEYKVGDRGTILGKKFNKPLKPALHRKDDAYLKVLIFNGSIHNLFVHRIVAEVHLNNNQAIQPGLEVNHKDKNRLNNTVSNLEIISKTENIWHRSFGEKTKLPF